MTSVVHPLLELYMPYQYIVSSDVTHTMSHVRYLEGTFNVAGNALSRILLNPYKNWRYSYIN